MWSRVLYLRENQYSIEIPHTGHAFGAVSKSARTTVLSRGPAALIRNWRSLIASDHLYACSDSPAFDLGSEARSAKIADSFKLEGFGNVASQHQRGSFNFSM